MDREIFDALTRRLSSGTCRRGVLGLLIGTVVGGPYGWHTMAEADDRKKKRRHRRRKKKRRHDADKGQEQAQGPDPVQDQCVPLTPVFDSPPASCASSSECCGDGTCCTYDDGPGGFISGCFDLLTHTTACGLSCETIVNCLNTDQQCVNGQCVDAAPE